MIGHKEVADLILHASSRRDLLMRQLGQLAGGPEGKQRDDEINREIDAIERDIWGLAIRAARAIHADDKEITHLRSRVSEYRLAHEGSEAVIHMAIARMGGLVEGRPTHRGNFLQRIDELMAMENRIVGMLDSEARP